MRALLCIWGLVFCLACNPKKPVNNSHEKVLFISHTRICDSEDPRKLNENVVSLDYSKFDLVIHGGDVLCQTSIDDEKFGLADSVFGFSSKNTLWVKGNHDDDNLSRLAHMNTGGKPYKLRKHGDCLFLVLDYFMTENHFNSDKYLELLKTLDSTETSNLIVLTHYLYWLDGHEEMNGLDTLISNVKICEDFEWCLKPNDFMRVVYPELCRLQKEGVNVYCIAGDMGVNRQTFHFKDQHQITFLGNGLNDKNVKDSVLVIDAVNGKPLTYSFQSILDL